MIEKVDYKMKIINFAPQPSGSSSVGSPANAGSQAEGLNAEVAQLVEHQLPKLRVAGSNPVFRSDSR